GYRTWSGLETAEMDDRERPGSKYIRWGERCLVKWADQIIVLSRDIQKYFHESYGRETVLIPNGVNRPERRKANLIKTILGLTEPYVLYLARLVPEKQADLLIKAFRKIPKESNGFKLVIAGGSSDKIERASGRQRV